MRVSCPNCSAAYEVPDTLVGGRPRRMRCAKCDTEFTAGAPAIEAASSDDEQYARTPEPPRSAPSLVTAEPLVPRGTAERPSFVESPPSLGDDETSTARAASGTLMVDRLVAQQRPPIRRRGGGPVVIAIAWMLTLLVLGAAAVAAYAYRVDIEQAWPPSQRLYAVLGLE